MNKAIFFDRDGTIIKEKNYIKNADEVEIIEGVSEVFSFFDKQGYLIFIVSNQSGIARGLITEEEYHCVDKKTKELISNGHLIKESFFCPHHPEITGNCSCRKPNALMLIQAQEKYNLDLSQSIVVGDKLSDVMLVESAGLSNGYLVQTGHGKEELLQGKLLPKNVKVVNSIKDIIE